jgi:apolipoprotein N-acyltransferase
MDEAQHLKIGLVQGNFGIKTYTIRKMKRRILSDMQKVSRQLQDEGAQMVVWGETAYPYMAFDREASHDLPTKHRRRVRRGFDIPIVFGAITADRTRENPYPWNTAYAMDSDGELIGRYDKNYPLVFGEYVPIVDPEWFTDLIPSASHLNRGEGPEIFEVAGHPMGPMICFEDLLPTFTRDIANAGASVFINLTNDSWFGKSWAQEEHLGLAVFRAVEHRRGLVRTVNAGVTAYVDPLGKVVERTEVTDSDTDGYQGAVGFVADVPMTDPEYVTVYGHFGHAFGFTCWFGVFGLGWRARKRRVRRDESEAA